MGIIQKQAISGTIFIYLGALIGFLTTGLIFPRILTPEQIGVVNLLVAYSLIFAQFGSLGFNSAMSRLFPYFRNPDNGHNGFMFIAVVVTFIGFILSALALAIYGYLILPNKAISSPLFAQYFWYILPLIFFTLFFNIFDNYNKLLFNAVRGIALKELVQRLLILGAIIIYYFTIVTFDRFVLIYVLAACSPAIIILSILASTKQIQLKPNKKFVDRKLKKELINVSFFGLLITATGILTINIDRIMLESLVSGNSLAAVGIYTTTFFFGSVVSLPARALTKISSTLLAEAWKVNDLKSIKTIYQKSTINQLWIGSFILLVIWANVDNIFQIIPEKYETGKYVILFIGLAYLSDMAAGVSSVLTSTSHKYRVQAIFMLVLALLVVITNYIFIPMYGIVGAAFASLISKLLVNIFRFFYLKYRFKLQPYNYKSILVVIIALVSYAPIYFLPEFTNIFVDILIQSTAVILIFSLLTLILKPSDDIQNLLVTYRNRFLRN